MWLKIITQLNNVGKSHWYWLFYIITGISLLAAALYSQFVHQEPPCLLCIEVRLLVTLLILVSIMGLCIGLWLHNYMLVRTIFQLSIILVIGSLAERSYQLLGTERGFVFSDCGFDLGLPSWFAIEQWLPWLYQVETSCGYTPEVLFSITMAEALMVLSVVLLGFSIAVFIAGIVCAKSKQCTS